MSIIQSAEAETASRSSTYGQTTTIVIPTSLHIPTTSPNTVTASVIYYFCRRALTLAMATYRMQRREATTIARTYLREACMRMPMSTIQAFYVLSNVQVFRSKPTPRSSRLTSTTARSCTDYWPSASGIRAGWKKRRDQPCPTVRTIPTSESRDRPTGSFRHSRSSDGRAHAGHKDAELDANSTSRPGPATARRGRASATRESERNLDRL